MVVEHDEDTIRRADHVLDLGPGAGKLGGHVVAEGTAAELMANPESVTGRFLAQPLRHPLHPRRKVEVRDTRPRRSCSAPACTTCSTSMRACRSAA